MNEQRSRIIKRIVRDQSWSQNVCGQCIDRSVQVKFGSKIYTVAFSHICVCRLGRLKVIHSLLD